MSAQRPELSARAACGMELAAPLRGTITSPRDATQRRVHAKKKRNPQRKLIMRTVLLTRVAALAASLVAGGALAAPLPLLPGGTGTTPACPTTPPCSTLPAAFLRAPVARPAPAWRRCRAPLLRSLRVREGSSR